MLDFAYNSTSPRRDAPELKPARALLTPTWIVALALLVANDHWLKGSGILPDLLTGKLSDFAGMLVAPALLASLLRVRSRRALLVCHLAVGAVFAGIQLAPGFAAQWSALMGLVGFPWVITCDPTDLIALPFLLLSWAVLVPEMDASKPALLPIQRTAVASLSVFGLWATVATSQDDGFGFDPNDEWYVDIEGNLFINNANDFTIALHVRPLRTDMPINCAEIARDPGRLLTQAAFATAEHWSLPARTTVGIELGSGQCGAVWVAGEGIAPMILFADPSVYRWSSFPGQVFEAEIDGLGDQAGLGLVFGDSGATWIGNPELRFAPKTEAPELPAGCGAPSGESRLDWQTKIPSRAVELLTVTSGIDGCHELEIQELTVTNNEVQVVSDPYSFYLCVPDDVAPFVAGERLSFFQVNNNETGQRELRVNLLDNESLAIATTQAGAPVRVIRYLRGGNQPKIVAAASGRELVAIPAVACPWEVESDCASVERSAQLAIQGEADFLEPGVPVSWTDVPETGTAFTMMVSYVRQRALVDLSCSDGARLLDYDIDLVIIEEPAL